MPIITIRGSLGSGAPEIGKQVAEKLHIDYIDREIIAEVAKRLKWSSAGIEKKEMPAGTLLGRIEEALSNSYIAGGYTGTAPEIYLPTWETPLDDSHYLTGLESVIKELASDRSVVIRGRGSQFILKDHPETVHVLVVAPLPIKLEIVMKDLGLDEKSAKKEIDRFDSSHREFSRRYFKAEIEDAVNYDLVLNTGALSYQAAASIIVDTVLIKCKSQKNTYTQISRN